MKSKATDLTFALTPAAIFSDQSSFLKAINELLSSGQALLHLMLDVHQYDIWKECLLSKPVPASPLVGSRTTMRGLPPLTEEIREELSPVILDGSRVVGPSPMFSTSHLPASTAPSGLPLRPRLVSTMLVQQGDQACNDGSILGMKSWRL
jgi:hypothetical protein